MQALSCVAHREDFTLDNVEQKNQAEILFNEALRMLQSMAHQNTNVVDRMKLMQISRNMVRLLPQAHPRQPLDGALDPRQVVAASDVCLLLQAVCHQPLEFAVMVRNILRNESTVISMVRSP